MRAIWIAAALALGLCHSAVAQAPSGEITLQAYAGIFEENYLAAVVQPFMQKFPGVKVTYFQGGNSAQMLGNLRAQKSSPQIDVTIQDVSVQKIANDEGLYAELDPAEIPNLNDLQPLARVAGKFGPAVTFDHFTLIYSTEAVKPAPTGLKDLWDPKNKGQLAFAAAPDIIGLSLTILTNKMEGGDYKQSIDPGVKKLRELAPLVQTFDPQPDNYTLIINGTARMGVAWNARSQLYSDISKGKLGVVLPAEGSAFQINTINLTKGSKNPVAAKAFINYALSPEAQKAFTERMFYGPTNNKAQINADAASRTSAGAENKQRIIPVDWNEMVKLRDNWTQRWRREVIPAGGR